MLAYYVMFSLPAIVLSQERRMTAVTSRIAWYLIGGLFCVLIGLRTEVGVDWNAFQRHFDITPDISLFPALQTSDTGYVFLDWIAASLDGSIYWVNVAFAIPMVGALLRLARREPLPWLFVTLAVPFF